MNPKVVLQFYVILKRQVTLSLLFLVTEVSHQENEDLPVKTSSRGLWDYKAANRSS